MSQEEVSQKEHWADYTAKKVVEAKGELKEYTVAAGITPSGVVHIGNFREIITVALVARGLERLGKKVRFIYSWDDYDVFRKVPANFPKKELLEKYLRQPIVDVPDPFGCHKSFAEHNEKAVEDKLPLLGVFPEFKYQARKYRACEYAEGMRKALLDSEKIKAVLDEWRAEDLGENWSPVRVFCSKCNADSTTITAYDGKYSLAYSCECGHKETFDFRKKGIAKLQWRVDWPMRWDFEKVRFEPSGKEHSSEGGSNTTAEIIVKDVYGFDAPFHLMYEFISIKGSGGKMSSSKGNTIDLREMLSVYEPSLIRYIFVRIAPSKSFEISFDGDVITLYDEFDRLERIYFGAEEAKSEASVDSLKRMYELSAVEIPKKLPFQPGLRHVATVLQSNFLDEKKAFDYFKGMAKTEFDKNRLRMRISCAKNWAENYAPEQFVFRVQDSVSNAAVMLEPKLKGAIKSFADSIKPSFSEEELGEALKKVSSAQNIQLADLFRACYIVFLGKERGPKLFQILNKETIPKFRALAQEAYSKKPVEKKKVSLPGQKELSKLVDFSVSPEIKKNFPQLRIGVVVAEGIDNSVNSDASVSVLRAQEADLKSFFAGKDFSTHPSIKAWRAAYSSFCAKPKEHKPSVEALVKRVLKGSSLPDINPLVNLYNSVSLKYVVPVGGDDLGKVKGKIELAYASGNESFIEIGFAENNPPLKGEVIYRNGKLALCRRWNWRECDATKLTEHTKKAIIYIESLSPEDDLESAVSETVSLIERHLGGKAKGFVV